jgi:hypothetical protein
VIANHEEAPTASLLSGTAKSKLFLNRLVTEAAITLKMV